jgi:DNA primase
MTGSTERRDLLRRVVEHYHRTLRESSEAQEYLTKRGLADPGVLTAFQAGYVDGSLSRMCDPDSARCLRQIGLLTIKGRELFGECVVFPLTLPDLGVVGLYGRHVRRDRQLYLPGPRRGVFHWQALKGSQEVILTDSVFSALSLYEVGFRNVSAIYGTQGLTADHEELLQRFRVRRVFLCLDNDEASMRATEAIAESLRNLGIEAVDAGIPGAKDPNALLVELGREAAAQAFRRALEEARRRLDQPATVGAPSPFTASSIPPPLAVKFRP